MEIQVNKGVCVCVGGWKGAGLRCVVVSGWTKERGSYLLKESEVPALAGSRLDNTHSAINTSKDIGRPEREQEKMALYLSFRNCHPPQPRTRSPSSRGSRSSSRRSSSYCYRCIKKRTTDSFGP